MKKRVIGIFIAILGVVMIAGKAPVSDAIQDLHKEIRFWKLVNELDLSQAQIEQMLPIVKEAVKVREDLEEKIKATEPERIQFLTQVRDELKQGRKPSEPLESEKEKIRSEHKALRNDAKGKMDGYQTSIEQILTQDQKAKLAKLPLDRPKMHQREPEGQEPPRHGQDMHRHGLFAIVGFIRNAPPEDIDERIDDLMADLEKKGEDTSVIRPALEQAVKNIREADEENLKEVVRENLENLPPELKRALHDEINPSKKRFAFAMSDPLFAKVLETRLADLKAGKYPVR